MNPDLKQQLIAEEGLKLKPYVDTVGKVTIGVGRNLTDVGISQDEAFLLLEHDVDTAVAACAQYAWFGTLNQARQCALVDLMVNIGATKFRGFKRMIAALEQGDYAAAAGQLRSSAWASQVQPSRRDRVVHQLATGANA
jgi:lysozyme